MTDPDEPPIIKQIGTIDPIVKVVVLVESTKVAIGFGAFVMLHDGLVAEVVDFTFGGKVCLWRRRPAFRRQVDPSEIAFATDDRVEALRRSRQLRRRNAQHQNKPESL
jgi:hypothetical protein